MSFVRLSRRINRGSTASRTVCSATVELPKKWRKTFSSSCTGRWTPSRRTSTLLHGCAESRCIVQPMPFAADHAPSMALPGSKTGCQKRPGEEGSLPLASEIERLLLALPPAQRVVVLLRYQEDLLPGEIAEILEMPLATVKSHLQRALKLMRARAEDTLREYTRHG